MMDAHAVRGAVIAEAMLWLRTPYHHNARVRGVGVDCAQFPAAVYEAVGLIPHVEPSYPHDWHLHRDEERYLDWIEKLGGRPISAEAAQAADFVVWKFGRTFSHGGIVLEPGQVIHSYVGIGVTIDDYERHEELKARPRLFFSVF